MRTSHSWLVGRINIIDVKTIEYPLFVIGNYGSCNEGRNFVVLWHKKGGRYFGGQLQKALDESMLQNTLLNANEDMSDHSEHEVSM